MDLLFHIVFVWILLIYRDELMVISIWYSLCCTHLLLRPIMVKAMCNEMLGMVSQKVLYALSLLLADSVFDSL